MDLNSSDISVLVIADTSPDETETVGGATGFIRALQGLRRANWHFASPLASGNGVSTSPDRAIALGSSIRGRLFPRRIQIAFRALRHWKRFRGFDVLYFHSNEAAMVVLAWPLSRLLVSPVTIIHQHGSASALSRPTFRFGRLSFVRALYDGMLRWAHRKADLIVAIDDPCVQKNLAWGVKPERIIKIPNAIDCGVFRPNLQAASNFRSRFSLPATTKLIAHVGRLEAVKRQDLLIRSLALLDKSHHLFIAGTGGLLPELRRLAHELNVSDRCHFLGSIGAAELVPLYCAADCLALTSEIEGVPMVLLEAFACGTPVVATNVGGVAEITPASCGILLEPDPAAAGIAQALADCLERPWDHAAIAAHAETFSVDKCCERLERAFRAAAVRRRVGADS